MKTQDVTFCQFVARNGLAAVAILIVGHSFSSHCRAAGNPQEMPFDSCTAEGCGETFLTGPTHRPIFQPSEPPILDETPPFIQQSPAESGNMPETSNAPDYSPPAMPQSAATPSIFSGGVEGTYAGQGSSPTGGYIDWAMPRTIFRLRFDAGFNNERPDRAEFFYAQCGCNPGAPGPGSPGPPARVNGSIDYQDLRGYLEVAANRRFSVFGEVPVRFLQTSRANGIPGSTDTGAAAGLSDLEAGFKYALFQDVNSIFTFQFKTYIPTGNASQGLGTNHVSLEPGFLAQSRVNRSLDVFGEFRDWIPVNGSTFNGSNYSGNVLRYGVGATYTVAETQQVRVRPVVEVVGWSVLDGQFLNTSPGSVGVENAATTIVNLKLGVRTIFKRNGSSLYLGYGRPLTGQSWYSDLARIEYTIFL